MAAGRRPSNVPAEPIEIPHARPGGVDLDPRQPAPPPTEPAWVTVRPGPEGRWPGPESLGLPGDHCGSRRVLTISLQIMINLRFSL
jgi:hypothetical protein